MEKRTIVALLEKAAGEYKDGPYALKKTDAGWEATSFEQTRGKARAIAAWLLEKGYAKNDAAVILSEGSPEWICVEFGLLSAGMVSVPLSIKLLPEEIPFRVSHSEAKLFATSRNQLDKVLPALVGAKLSPSLIYLDDDAQALDAEIGRAHV